MADKRWKKTERDIAKRYYDSKRRGADTSRDNAGVLDLGRVGNSDIFYPGASIEVKDYQKISYSLLYSAVAQAEKAKTGESEIAVAHIHQKGMRLDDVWTALPLPDWGRLVGQSRFGVFKLYYTLILPRNGLFYNKHIELAMNNAKASDKSIGKLDVAIFHSTIPPVLVIMRLHHFYDWFLKDYTSLI